MPEEQPKPLEGQPDPTRVVSDAQLDAEASQTKAARTPHEKLMEKSAEFDRAKVKAEDEAALNDSEDRGTQTAAKKGQEAKVETPAPDDKTKVDASVSEAKKVEPESRYNKDIREAKARVKELEARLAEKEKADPPKPIVPEPTPPQYKREELAQWKAQQRAARDQAELAGDHSAKALAQGYLDRIEAEERQWDSYDVDKKLWEVKNGQAVEARNQRISYYQQKVLAEFPDAKNPESELNKAFVGLGNDPEIAEMAHKFKEEPGAVYAFAKLGDLALKASQRDAFAEQMKKKDEEIASLKAKLEPIPGSTGGEKTDGPPDSKESPKAKMRRRLREMGHSVG